MANSSDSSVWRNLAIALGDGLAFGMGVKLTQAGGRSQVAVPPQTGPLVQRVSELERRLEEMVLALARAESPPPAPAAFDRKMLETVARNVVGALDTRLQEQDARMEQRLAEFRATFDRQDASDAANADARIAEVQEGYRELADEFHHRLEEECQALDERLIAVHSELSEALPRAVETAVERKFGGLRFEADNKEREIGALRAQLAGSNARTMALLEAIGQAVRAATASVSPPSLSPEAPPEPAPPASPEPAAEPHDQPVPGFAVAGKPARLWRVPLVSSMIVACGALALLRYL